MALPLLQKSHQRKTLMMDWREDEETNPTMERPKTDQSLTDKDLQELLENLEEEWESMKQNQANPSTSIIEAFQLLDGSPRSLMSSVQTRGSTSDGSVWNVRDNDLVAEEIARERKAAIESGKFKGKRLFEDDESEARSVLSCGDEQVGAAAGDKVLLSPVCYVCSCSCSSSSSSVTPGVDQKVDSHVVAAKSWRRREVFLGLISIPMVVFAIGLVLKMGFDGFVDEQVILVPT